MATYRGPGGGWLALAGLYLAIVVFLTWPQAVAMSSVPMHHDTLFSVWRIAWVAHQVIRDALHLFDANIFAPEPRTLAYSHAVLLQGLASAPLIWLGVPPVVAYNALVLVSFVACGLGMALLAWELTRGREAALVAGLVFAASRMARAVPQEPAPRMATFGGRSTPVSAAFPRPLLRPGSPALAGVA